MRRKQAMGIMLAAAVLVSGFPAGGVTAALAKERQSLTDEWDGSADTSWYTGHENESVYEIYTAEQLAGMAKLSGEQRIGFAGKTFQLMADLDLKGIEWTPISRNGNNSGEGAFAGTFEGNYHVIRNLTATEKGNNGLFTSITGGTVRNLGIEDAEIIQGGGYFYQGILAAWIADGAQIINCYTTGSVTLNKSLWSSVGGIAGFATGGGKVIGCYSSAEVRSEEEEDYTGSISGGVGGIIGMRSGSTDSTFLIADCYFNGSIYNMSGNKAPGGILGIDFTLKNGLSGLTIRNCFSAPTSVSAPKAPENFTYIGIFNGVGKLSDCYYMEPKAESDEAAEYLPAYMLEKGDYDPFAEEDVEKLDTMSGSSFVKRLNEKANKSPKVIWTEGKDHPTFSWDKRNIPASLDVTATASNASEAYVTAVSDMDGTALYAVIEAGTLEPSDVKELEDMVKNQVGAAAGTVHVTAGKLIPLTIGNLEANTEYTVFMAAKNQYDLWSGLTSKKFKTRRDVLTGSVALSGFPVTGETLITELAGIQEDAEPVFTWYRGKTEIDGESGDSYTLAEEDIGSTIQVKVTSTLYEGTLESNSTPKIAKEYSVTKIVVTKKPDKMVYGRDEQFDRTGMEVTAYLKASASNATPSTAQKLLSENEYDTDYDFSSSGKATVTVSYMGMSTELEVMVTEENLEGEVTLSGYPVVGETLKADLTGVQPDAKVLYSWYRDGVKINRAIGDSYVIQKEDTGHRIYVEIISSQYAGKLVSDPTDTIQRDYVVSGITVTKLPDKVKYRRYELLDDRGMEITVYLKVNALDSSPVAKRILAAHEYEVSYDFGRVGTETVTINYRWNGAVYSDEFQVTVEERQSDNASDSSDNETSGGTSGRSASEKSSLKPQDGSWIQEETGSWKFQKSNGEFAVSEWIYTSGGGKNDWYHFDETGSLQSGWFTESGKWYYLNKNHDGFYGAMITGWLLADDGYWYYFDLKDGAMMTGWQQIGGKWYYLNPVSSDVTWKVDENGNWKWIGTAVMPYGAMYADKVTPDGFLTGTDGAWVE